MSRFIGSLVAVMFLTACSDTDALTSVDYAMLDLCPTVLAMDEQLKLNPTLLVAMVEPGTVGELNLEVIKGALVACRVWAKDGN